MAAASGVAAMVVLLVVLYRLLPAPAADSAGERIAYAMRWNSLADFLFDGLHEPRTARFGPVLAVTSP
jgi:hypothetical protein